MPATWIRGDAITANDDSFRPANWLTTVDGPLELSTSSMLLPTMPEVEAFRQYVEVLSTFRIEEHERKAQANVSETVAGAAGHQ